MNIWPFNRKKKQEQSVLPQEVQEYYQATKKERRGTAWLLALGTLVVTFVLAAILFFAGRWLYQKLTGNNDNQPIPVQNETQNQNSQTGTNNNSSQEETNDQSNNSQNDIVDAPADGSDNNGTEQSETPATGPTTPEIPNTGPGPGGLQ